MGVVEAEEEEEARVAEVGYHRQNRFLPHLRMLNRAGKRVKATPAAASMHH